MFELIKKFYRASIYSSQREEAQTKEEQCLSKVAGF
jgi:hypothetical protein